MTHSESIKSIMAAIGNVQKAAGDIRKTGKGQVGSRTYNYATLSDTWETISALLASNGLVVYQSPSLDSSKGHTFFTMLYHTASEEWISEHMMLILQRDDPQGIGSAITYYRRYMLTSMLGLIPKEDNDAREHRLATAEQKMRLVGAVKAVAGTDVKPDQIVSTIMDITGKHPKNIREDEAEKMIELVRAFGTNKTVDNSK